MWEYKYIIYMDQHLTYYLGGYSIGFGTYSHL